VRKGDRFDVAVEVPSDCDTSSLTGGWLMETRLAEMAVLGSRVRDGHVLGMAEGALLVDPVSHGTLDSKSKLRALVPGGGVSLTTRPIGLVILPEHRSIALSKRIGDSINARFHAVIKGSRRGVATPKTDRFIELEIPASYRQNLARYVRVVRSVAVVEPQGGRQARLELLGRQLNDPVTAPSAALRLEAIGKDAVVTLKKALGSKDPEVRFAAAEALAYLGEPMAAEPLAEAAATLRASRPAALAALASMDDANGIDALQSLLASASAETRYGAFRSLWKMDSSIPLVKGEKLADACTLHVLDVGGPTLIHATRMHHPEIVLFGTEHPLADGLRAEAGSAIVVAVEGGTASCTRFTPGEPDRAEEVPARVDEVLRAIARLGATYPDVVQLLQQAVAQHALSARLAFDAVPTEEDGRGSLRDEVSLRDRDDSSADAARGSATGAVRSDEAS
jgi:hypothetical protein